MDGKVFAGVLKNPALLRNHGMDELERLNQRHPYASLLNALMARKAYDENSSGQEYYLNRAAIRVPDRKRLFHLIHSQIDESAVIPEEELPEEKQQVVAEVPQTEIPQTEIPRIEPITPHPEQLVKISIPEEQQRPVVGKEEKPKILEQVREDESLKLPGMEEAVDAIKSINESQKETDVEEVSPVVQLSDIEKLREVEANPADEKHSFAEWLGLVQEKMETSDVPSFQQEVSEKDEIKLSKDTSLSPTDEAGIVQKAKESLSDDLEWVTETLAKVYELQKKFDKAEDAYRRLSLKYPEKKAYFAQRIEDLKSRMKK